MLEISAYHRRQIVPVMIATSLGTLRVLPREVRDKIYGYVLGGSYMIARTALLLDRTPWRKVNFAILATSKQINTEGMRMLYAASQFVYRFTHPHNYIYGQSLSVSRTMTDEIWRNLMNITLIVEMNYRSTFYMLAGPQRKSIEDFFGELSEASLRRLCRDDVIRRRINIKYTVLNLANWFEDILTLPLLQDIKRLTCFRSVILEFVSTEKEFIPGYTDGFDEIQHYGSSCKYVGAIKADFETTLGPATTIDGLVTAQAHLSTASDTESLGNSAKAVDFGLALHDFDWRLEFHPLDHRVTI